MGLISRNVEIGVNSIKCEWSTQMVSDLNSFHSIDTSSLLESLFIEFRKELILKKIEKILNHK